MLQMAAGRSDGGVNGHVRLRRTLCRIGIGVRQHRGDRQKSSAHIVPQPAIAVAVGSRLVALALGPFRALGSGGDFFIAGMPCGSLQSTISAADRFSA